LYIVKMYSLLTGCRVAAAGFGAAATPLPSAVVIGRFALVICLALLAAATPAGGSAPLDRLVFMSERSGTWQLWLRDASGVHRVTRNAKADSDPAFSPDGTKLAFVRDSGSWQRPVIVLDLETGVERRLVWARYTAAPRWSPDGTKVAYQVSKSFSADGAPDGAREDLWVVDAYGGGARRVARGMGYAEWAWSPDSTRLVFVSDAYGEPALFAVGARDGRSRMLTEGREPAWSPRGTIAFVRDGDLRSIRPTRRLTRDAVRQRFPSWSQDGRLLAFVERRPSFGSAVGVMRADGSARRIVAAVRAHASRPIWSPDGRELTFGSDTGETFVVRVDGRGGMRVIHGLQPDWRRAAPRWTGPR
jgi:TolB protein